MPPKDLKKILDDHKIDHKDIHQKEEFIDMILREDSKKRMEEPRSNLGHDREDKR